jgi:succinate dehydrogenase/fumarate reductase flavoprotein subunit
MKNYDAIIIGSGAGGYSAADWLYKSGIKDIAIVTENSKFGTSRNTGSDKQTYYKLSLDGLTDDSAYKMAQDIASGGSCDGELAYIEAVNSARCFYRLVEYGVPFPTDNYGGYAGYKTDHDNTTRATSIGPLTSKVMTEKLEEKVLRVNRTQLLDNLLVVKILVFNGQAYGILAYDKKSGKIIKKTANNIIVATGAPACIYDKSVYPISQHGMTGVLIEAGAKLVNFCEWQYGLASIDFRWNVSGSYLQVIPRIYSVDKNGVEKEFLLDYYDNATKAYDNLFLKGYQWPFSADKIDGSSKIDMLVQQENNKGNSVYLDYTRNPSDYEFELLGEETRQYLQKANADGGTPYDRLMKLNVKAVELFASHRIYLQNHPLKVSICAQHNNGGVWVDSNYQTSIKNLFAVGEVAGVFGITRQGGTALNSTQVGGLIVAKYINANSEFDKVNYSGIAEKKSYQKILESISLDISINYKKITEEMSKYAGFLRNSDKINQLKIEIDSILENFPHKARTKESYFYNKDMLISAKSLLEAIIGTMDKTGSRGGALFYKNGEVMPENKEYKKYRAVQNGSNINFEQLSKIPNEKFVFENLLNKSAKILEEK